MSEDKLVTVAEFVNSFDANLAKMTLDNAGIQSVLLGEHLVANMIYGIPAVTIELQVCQSEAERAKQLLNEHLEIQSGDQ